MNCSVWDKFMTLMYPRSPQKLTIKRSNSSTRHFISTTLN